MATPEPPTPKAEGDLARTPFAHVLLYLMQHGLSGTLVLWPEEGDRDARGQDRIRFEAGRPDAAFLRAPTSRLDIGLLSLFGRRDGPYAFYEADLVGEGGEIVSGNVEPLHLLAAATRGSIREDAVDAVVARFGDARLRLVPGVRLSDYGLDPKQSAIVELLRAEPSTLAALSELAGDERTARRMIYLLGITKAVEPFDGATPRARARAQDAPAEHRAPVAAAPPRAGGSPPGGTIRGRAPVGSSGAVRPAAGPKPHKGPEPPPHPPADLPPELDARWREVARKAVAIDKQNYFQMLQIATSAGGRDVQTAYLNLVKTWHPDRLAPELSALEPWVDRIFDHLTKAKELLENDDTRAEHLRQVQAGGGTPESDRKVEAIVDAAMLFQKAEVLCRKREWDAALDLLTEAKSLNDQDGDFFALEGWIQLEKHAGADAPWERIHGSIDRALELSPRSERALLYKARVLKRQGKERMALEQFRKIAELNPRNTEAMREVRVATMREGGGPKGSTGSESIIKRLFGSGKKKS